MSFALVVFTLNQLNTRKHDLYFRFKTCLFEFDKFLKDYSAKDAIIHEALALSWDLKFLKIDDFPLMNWKDRLTPWVGVMNDWNYPEEQARGSESNPPENDDPNLVNRILGFLGYLEIIVNEIGVMCVGQIRAGRLTALVMKALVVLALLLVVLVVCYETGLPWLWPALVATPVFFISFAVFMLFEIAYFLHREDRENLSFVAWDDDRADADEEEESVEPLEWRRS
ncbi:MAG TPA: hypothetical protein VK635_19125 [Bradyrhizobium sp.]|nr:hypothetical protein [Bradyrhizobium sp.]